MFDSNKITFDSNASKRISFVLLTKNKGKNLDETLARSRNLITPKDELIVVDGGSKDETAEVIKKYGDLVSVFVTEPDLHAMHAHNKAILLSSGKYIKLLTDNDIFHAEGIEAAVKVMESNPEIDLLLCGGVKEYRGRKRPVYLPANSNYGRKPEDAFTYKGADTGVGHFVRRSAFTKAGLIGFNVNSDKEFVLRCIKNRCVVRFARINLYYHILADDSLVLRNAAVHKADTIRLAKEYCNASFYLKYRIGMIFKESKFLKPFYLLYLGIARRFKKPTKKIEYIWDGGLS